MMVAIAAIIGLAFMLIATPLQRGTPQRVDAPHPLDGMGGDFSLTDDRGQPVTQESLRGRPTLIFFGFTHCPDVCPTALFEMSERMKELGPEADRLNYVFVSVDPERDTPEQMRLYLEAFDPRIRGFTGSTTEVAAIIKAYKGHARRIPLEGGGYTMDHTASIYGLDSKARVRLLIDYHESREMVLAKIRRLMAVP
jgi:protein SCO1